MRWAVESLRTRLTIGERGAFAAAKAKHVEGGFRSSARPFSVFPVHLRELLLLGPKLLLPMGCVKLGEKNCVHLPSVGEQTAN